VKPPDLVGSARRFAAHNLVLKLIALGLAVACWLFVAGESKVLVGINVPLEIRDVPKGMTVANKVERQVELRLAGPSSLLSGLKASDVTATINLSGAKAGRQTVPVDDRAVKVPSGIAVQRIFPTSVDIVLERTERRAVPVVARIGGSGAVKRNIAKVEVDPPSVEVEALPDEFSRMPVVYTEEVTPDRDADPFTAEARVELREPHAKIVGKSDVRVTVRFRKQEGAR
jgi:YbbR domain-containing protein